jgi:hypothetical protein
MHASNGRNGSDASNGDTDGWQKPGNSSFLRIGHYAQFSIATARNIPLDFSSAAIGIPMGRIAPIAPIALIDLPRAADPHPPE